MSEEEKEGANTFDKLAAKTLLNKWRSYKNAPVMQVHSPDATYDEDENEIDAYLKNLRKEQNKLKKISANHLRAPKSNPALTAKQQRRFDELNAFFDWEDDKDRYADEYIEPGKIPVTTFDSPAGHTYIMGDSDEDKFYERLQENFNPIMKQRNEITTNLAKLIYDQHQKFYETSRDKLKSEAGKYETELDKLDPNIVLQTIGEKAIKHYDPTLYSEMESSLEKHQEIVDAQEKYDDAMNELSHLKGLIKELDDTKSVQGAVSKYNGENFTVMLQLALKTLGIDPDLFLKATIGKYKNEEGAEEARQQLNKLLDDIENNQTLLLNAKKVNQMNRMQKQLNQVTELQDRITTDIKSRDVYLDRHDEFYAKAEPTLDAYKELISKYSKFLTPDVITDLETEVKQINDYINDARLKGFKAGEIKKYNDLVDKVRNNVRNHYQDILNKLNAYSNSVSAEDAIINEIKSLASYEQYSQLPPNIFEKLPEDIKSKVMRLMELKAKLQKQQGKTKNISQKYKINASNKPVSEDKEHAKVFNPMLNRGYAIFNKVAQHNAYNAGFL